MTRPGLGLRLSQCRSTSRREPAPTRHGGRAGGGNRVSLTRLISGLLVLPAVLGALATAGCGAGPTSLSVSLTLPSGDHNVAPGQTVGFQITVTDTGAAATAGLTVTADLPADFRYTDTGTLAGGAVRTAPVEAQVYSQQPTWGVWELSGYNDSVTIPFDALAEGNPGTYSMTASASASTATTAQSSPLSFKLTSAPLLSATVSVSPSTAVPGEDVVYEVSVYNKGTGPAESVSVLVTLPPVFIYDGALPTTGNAGRIGGTDPLEGSALPYFDGFSIPAQGPAGPGTLTLKFDAHVLTDAGAEGVYPVGVQVLGDSGAERVYIAEAAPVTVG